MDILTYVLLLIVTTLIEGVVSYEYCYNWHHSTTYYCQYGCCGDSWDRYCCYFNVTGLIVGCVIGAIVLIACIVVAIVFYKKQKGHSGRVVAPSTHTVAVVNTTGQPNYTTQNYPGSTYGQPYPPPYGQTYPPSYPASGANNQPAYPPPSQPMGQAQYPPGPPPGASMYDTGK